jgi:uncharacterized membrane protein YfcA
MELIIGLALFGLLVIYGVLYYLLQKRKIKQQNAWKNSGPLLGVVLPTSKKEKKDE